jgi:hypothetical protein
MRSIDDAIREAIVESDRVQQETRELLKQGLIDQKEADHRMGNAAQVVLFAEHAADRLKKITANRA